MARVLCFSSRVNIHLLFSDVITNQPNILIIGIYILDVNQCYFVTMGQFSTFVLFKFVVATAECENEIPYSVINWRIYHMQKNKPKRNICVRIITPIWLLLLLSIDDTVHHFFI